MSNKQFKVMVVPRWFTITPETVKALAYVYDYHVRDMPAFLKPNVLNITEALRAKFRLEGIVQMHSVLDKTRWDYIQGCKKLANPDPMGYWTGIIGCNNADPVRDFNGSIITDSSTGLSHKENEELFNRLRTFQKQRGAKLELLTGLNEPILNGKEVEFPSGTFDQYNRDCTRQGTVEMKMVNRHLDVQLKPEYNFNRGKETALGWTKEIGYLQYRKV